MSEYSLWLMPDRANTEKFRSIISRLAEENLSEVFEPHITLLKVKECRKEDALVRAENLAKKIGSFVVKLKKAGHENRFFHCVFVGAEKSKELMSARSAAARIFLTDESDYAPHMSLLYSDISDKRTGKIIADIGDVSASVKTQSLWLVRNDRPEAKTTRYWHVEGKFPLV